MRNGYNNISSENDDIEGLSLKSCETYIQPFLTRKFYGKDWQKFIDSVKLMVRSSDEYKEFINIVKSHEGLKNCAFLGNIDDSDGEVDIEIHHTPFTIHDIIEIISDCMITECPLTTFDVAHRVIEEHFLGNVGVVPVSKTIHELIHDGKINVNIDQVFGNINEFIKRYKFGITKDHLKKLELFIKLGDESRENSNKNKLLELNKDVLINPVNNQLSYNGLKLLLENR